MLIWLRFWANGWRLRFWEMDIFGSLILFYCAPARTCITSLLDMAINFNWFIKITRSFGSGFRSQNIAKPKVRLIIIKNRSKQTFLPDQIKEHFGLWTGYSFSDCCFFLYVNIMFIAYTVSGTMGLTFPGLGYVFFIFLFLRRGTYYCCMLPFWGHADPWIFSVSASYRCENSIDPREISIASTQCWASFRLAVRSTLGKSSQPYFCSHSNDSIR